MFYMIVRFFGVLYVVVEYFVFFVFMIYMCFAMLCVFGVFISTCYISLCNFLGQ